MTPVVVVAVLVAGALGAVLRYLVSIALAAHLARVPAGVLTVNVIGSAVAGVALGLAEAGAWDPAVRLVVISGFCGGLTTFSTFADETVDLIIEGQVRAAALSVGANVVLGIGACAAAWGLTLALAG